MTFISVSTCFHKQDKWKFSLIFYPLIASNNDYPVKTVHETSVVHRVIKAIVIVTWIHAIV